jgi:hypothetical protein
MAAPLKHLVGPAMVLEIANRISFHMPAFNTAAFIQQFVAHYGELELMPRCHWVAQCLHQHLPKDYPTAVDI